MAIRYADWTNGQDFSKTRDRATNITAWSASTTYALDALVNDNVAYPNRKCYKSLQAGNLNHALTDAAWWVLVADGSAALPFQSITDATQGLTGGDECRIAKSPDDTPLSGTLTFTEGSTTLTGSGTAFTTELVIGDFVYGGDGVEYEIITITSDTAAVLYKKYFGSTQSGVACIKVGMTDVGYVPGIMQTISSSGVSVSRRLKISGGWNLATETRTGKTYFKQNRPGYTTKTGTGAKATQRMYLDFGENIGFFRFNGGIIIESLSQGGNIINQIKCISNQYQGIAYAGNNSDELYRVVSSCNGGFGIELNQSINIKMVEPISCSNGGNAFYIINYSNNCKIISPIMKYNQGTDQLYTSLINNLQIINPIIIGLITHNNKVATDRVAISIQKYNGVKDDNRNYFFGGTTKSNTANARSGKCLEYNPTSVDVYMSHSFFFKAVDATACTLSAYIQKNAAFNGDVQGAVYFLGLPVIDWTDITPTANDTYEKKSFSVTSGMVTDDSVLELRINVRGTAGAVYVDDLEQV